MFTRLPRHSFVIGFLSLFLLTAATASFMIFPVISSANGNSLAEFVLQSPTDNVLRLSITSNDIIYNPKDKTIYASQPSSVGDKGNSLTRINPLTGEVGESVFVGSEPNKLALSDNGETLYVALDGAYAIRRYDITTQTPGIQFAIGRETTSSFPLGSPYLASDIAVAPGNPNVLAVARYLPGISPPGTGVAIFNNGVQLPRVGPGHSAGANYLAFSNSSATLYGGGYYEGLRTMTVDETGVTDNTGNNGTSFAVKKLKFENNLIFTSTGQVIDAQTRRLTGTFAGINTLTFAPATEVGRVLYAVRESNTNYVTIKAFDINTFIQVDSLSIPNVTGEPTTLIRYGTNGLAMRTSDNKIYLIQTALIPTSDPLPTPSGTPSVTPTPTPAIYEKFVRSIALPNKDFIYSTSEKKFYASVPSSAAAPRGNSITRIEPETGVLENSVAVGSEPGRLALSDDEKTLYVGIDGANAIRKFDVPTQTPGLQFALGSGTNGPKQAYDIDVMPDNPNTVAVSYGSSSYNYDGAEIFDEGVRRAQKSNTSGSVEFASPTLLYVGENLLYKYTVNPNGLSAAGSFTTLNYGEYELVNGLIYTANGGVIDAATGTFKGSFTGLGYSSAVSVDKANNRVFFLTNSNSGTGSGYAIRAYRLDNFLFVGSVSVGEIFFYNVPRRLVRWGTNGLAFKGDNDKIHFIQTTLVSADGIVPTPTPTPTPTATPSPSVSPTPTATPSPTPPATTFVRRVNVPVNDFVYSNFAQAIYASVPSIAGVGRGNTITKINPKDGTIGSSVFVGSEPNKMAVSDDGKTIYTKLDGAIAVRRFDVPTQTASLQFTPQSPFYNVEDMAVQPGNPNVIAIANGYDGVAIYDDGVQRPVYGDGGAYGIYSIDFADAATLYGYDNYSSGFELIKFTVNSSGITGVNIGNNRVTGYGVRIKYSNGLIYSTGGRVINPSNGTQVGSFQSGGSTMAIDQESGRIFFMNENVLTAYDINTFLKIGSVTLSAFSGTPYGLVRWGENGLAFRTTNSATSGYPNNSQLYLIQSALVSPSAVVPTGIQFSLPTYSGYESTNNLQVIITRNGDVSAASTVDYTTSDGTATAGEDYTETAGTLSFTAGETTKTINIPIINDSIFEGTESFNFTLSNVTGGTNTTLTYPNTATLTIFDNDYQPIVSSPNISVNEPPMVGTATALFTVRLSNQTTQTATVNYATSDGTATAGSDYVATSGLLTFAPLETIKTIAVQILADDKFDEPNETFKINFSNAVNASINNSQVTITILNYDPQTVRRVRFDFDGDGKSDISVFRSDGGNWYLNQSSLGFVAQQFGIASDKLVPADYDGDGRTDIAVNRNGIWYILMSTTGGFRSIQFGLPDDVPVPADYDGDGKDDIAVFRPSSGVWYLMQSTAGFAAVPFGTSTDKTVFGDYDGDGKKDIAVVRQANGVSIWYILASTKGFYSTQFGTDTDKLVPADYDGDGKTDLAVFRPSNGSWYINRSTQGYTGIQFGNSTDLPTPADYDGDGKADVAVFRAGVWYLQRSTAGFAGIQFGAGTDKPVPYAFNP